MKYRDYYEYLLVEMDVRSKEVVKVPKEAGSEFIPSNHLRLYHYTDVGVEELRRDGLLLSKAKGHTYGEPDFVWASLKKPSDYKRYVEFSVPIDDDRFSKWGGSAPDVERGVEFYKGRSNDFTFRGDIKPEEFIAIHEPWHHRYRYMTEESKDIQDVLDGKYDYLTIDRFPDEAKAIEVIKMNYGESERQ